MRFDFFNNQDKEKASVLFLFWAFIFRDYGQCLYYQLGYHVMYFGVLREEKKVESILLLYVWDAEVRNIQRDYSFIYGLIFRR